MSFAVVKFLKYNGDSSDHKEVIVSEVPISWLTNDNTYCKWPPEKYSSIYISKSFPPQKYWEEYPVEVESICDTLAEAKLKAKGESDGDIENSVGRGCRKITPRDYFSPAEEEAKANKDRKKRLHSKKNSGYSTRSSNPANYKHSIVLDRFESKMKRNSSHHYEFTRLLNSEILIEENEVGSMIVNENNPLYEETGIIILSKTDTEDEEEGTVNCEVTTNPLEPSKILQNNSCSSAVNAGADSLTVVTDIHTVLSRIEAVFKFLSEIKLDIDEIKEKLDDFSSPRATRKEFTPPVALPLKTLTEIESLEDIITGSDERKTAYINSLRSIGGHDCKDFTNRICRTLFTNSLAETYSWLGRKNNFAVGNLQFTNLAFGVVHQKTKCSKKDFELAFSEWLRHAKQRRLSEEAKT